MPLQRVSQGFKDLSMTFKRNPLNDDVLGLKNERAIARSVRNIVFTEPGEKPFDEEFGSRITQSLFENIDDLTGESIKDEIESSINRYEPRVRLIRVVTTPNPDNNAYDVIIAYEIIGADVPPQELEFVLQPTR